jgi:hypothetical protein
MLYSYCHFARTDPFHQCFSMKVDKKYLYETPAVQNALGGNDGGCGVRAKAAAEGAAATQEQQRHGPRATVVHGGARGGHGFQRGHSGHQGHDFQGQSGHH